MHTLTKTEIISSCEANPLQEVCGFVVLQDKAKVIQCQNISSTPETSFLIHPSEFIKAKSQGQIISLWHSHPSSAAFSEADLSYGDEINLPLHLYNIQSKEWSEYIPKTYRVPLTGRPFIWGHYDCFGLVRDYFRQEKGVYINDYDRDENFEQTKDVRIWDNFEKEGFLKLPGLGAIKNDDVIIFNTNAMPQHLGIFVGNTQIMHHPLNAISRLDRFNANWQKRAKVIVRHKSLF